MSAGQVRHRCDLAGPVVQSGLSGGFFVVHNASLEDTLGRVLVREQRIPGFSWVSSNRPMILLECFSGGLLRCCVVQSSEAENQDLSEVCCSS